MTGTALVTGCSTGFGRAIAIELARHGYDVIATLRDGAALADAARDLTEAAGRPVEVRRLDVTDQASVDELLAGVEADHGRLDVLVNNAGIAIAGAIEAVDDADLRRVFDTNVFGAVAVTKACLPLLRRSEGGRIVFISAIGAILNTPYLGVYAASKHAVDSIAAAWDVELRQFGIRVSSVLPGPFKTALSGNMQSADDVGGPYEESTRQYLEGLRGRLENGPSDLTPVVAAVLHAATDPSPQVRYVVGSEVITGLLTPVCDQLAVLHEREVASVTPAAR